MIGDKRVVSEAFLNELVSIGLTVQDIEDTLMNKFAERARERGIIVKVPKEALDVFFSNINNRTSHRVYLSQTSIQTYKQVLGQLYIYSTHNSDHELEVGELLTYIIPFLTECKEKLEPKLKPSTLNKYTAVLRTFIHETAFHYQLSEGRMPRFLPRVQNLPQALSDTEVKQLLEIASSSQYGLRALFMVSFFLGTGVRRNEFRGIRRGDIDFVNSSVKVHGKGDRDRVIHIPTNLRPLINAYFETYGITAPKHYIYPGLNRAAGKIGSSTIDDTVQRLFKKLPNYDKNDPVHHYHLHTFRHTYAVALLRAGVSLRTIAQVLGHRSVRTTEIYTVLNADHLREQLKPGLDKMSEWWGGYFYA